MMGSLLKQKSKITKVSKGEVWLAFDDHSIKKRPFIIMSDKLSGIDVDVTATPTTSKKVRNEFDIEIEYWKEAGLNEPSIARCSKIHVFNYLQLIRKLGKMHENDMVKINESIKMFLGLFE